MSNGYISVVPDEASKNFLDAVSNLLGLKPEDYVDYHITLIYDKRNPPISITPSTDSYKVRVTGADILNGCLVLHVASKKLSKRYTEILAAGYESDYPEFKPHITLIKGTATEDQKDYLNSFGWEQVLTFEDETHKRAKVQV